MDVAFEIKKNAVEVFKYQKCQTRGLMPQRRLQNPGRDIS
jgi:hypothetical protein